MDKPGDSDARWYSKWLTRARHYQDRLERRPWVAFPLESFRRFNKIKGVYWERKAGPAAVAKMEELSAEISTAMAD